MSHAANNSRTPDAQSSALALAPCSAHRTCGIEPIYRYRLKTGTGIGIVGYELWDTSTGERLKTSSTRTDAARWAKRRGWTIA